MNKLYYSLLITSKKKKLLVSKGEKCNEITEYFVKSHRNPSVHRLTTPTHNRPYALTSRLHNNDAMLGVKTCRAPRTCCAGRAHWCSASQSVRGPGTTYSLHRHRPGRVHCVRIFTHFPCYEPACWSLNFMHFQTSVIRLVDRLT